MKKIAVFAFLALATSTWATSPPARGTKVDCLKFLIKYGKIACPRNLAPICGTDQITYSNECMLCMENQGKSLQPRKLHDGHCVECTGYSNACTMEFIPHCGSDKVTYPNRCQFCNGVAKSRGTLYLANYGSCSDDLGQQKFL